MRSRAVLLLTVMMTATLLMVASPAWATTFTVNSTADLDQSPNEPGCFTGRLVPGGDISLVRECTLRAAIQQANALRGTSDNIDFASWLNGTITLTQGLLTIANDTSGPDLTIEGLGGSGLTVSGINTDRVFLINSGADVTINRLTISGGSKGFGGGILNNGTLTLTNATVSANTAEQVGGGIFNGGTLTVRNSTVSANEAAGLGGGIYNGGTLMLTNATVSANTAVEDGGIHTEGGVGTAKLTNTIVARNAATTDDPDVSGLFTSLGNNLIGNTSGSGSTNWSDSDLLNQDPLIGPLQNNGGPTNTHALLQGSPAIDRATNFGCPSTDQRGFTRTDGDADGTATCDIGAFEAANTKPTITDLRPAPGSKTRDRTPPIAATVSDAQTNLAMTNIKLFVDGSRKATFSYAPSTDRLSYTSGRLSFGRHTVKIIATEGLNRTTRSWRLTVVRR